MASKTSRRQGELVKGVLELLLKYPDGLQANKVISKLKAVVPPTTHEMGEYESAPGVMRYDRVVRFATIPAVKAGWINKTKTGLWSITDEGKNAYRKYSDPEEMGRDLQKIYKEWERKHKKRQPSTPTTEEGVGEQEIEQAAIALEEARESAWLEIQNYLHRLDPYDFQQLVAALLRGMGYHVDWVAPPGPDRGIDIIAHQDPLGVSGPRIKVQVKRQASRVDVKDTRGFIAVLGEGDIGVFVSTGGFTREAENEVRRLENRRVMLVDIERLVGLWIEYYKTIPEESRHLLPLIPVYFLDARD
ncbi:restriction endonuclease [Oceanithermus sp.]|uniref:restriction endonuclease n=1 Tax=Oceanithermus sp. TaxID=2268145 RepID=UPI00257F1737|nr:restriction endonuclease [Oceanithermus sp.]